MQLFTMYMGIYSSYRHGTGVHRTVHAMEYTLQCRNL